MKQTRKHLLLVPAIAAVFLYACGGSNHTDNTAAVPSSDEQAAALFTAKCSMCHDFKQDKIGPALSGVVSRWNNDTARLKQFIRNSKAMISSGDPYAGELYKKWNQSEMPSFPGISDAEMEALIQYLR